MATAAQLKAIRKRYNLGEFAGSKKKKRRTKYFYPGGPPERKRKPKPYHPFGL